MFDKELQRWLREAEKNRKLSEERKTAISIKEDDEQKAQKKKQLQKIKTQENSNRFFNEMRKRDF